MIGMTFAGFAEKDFETFDIDGLEERMGEIRNRIQPKFQEAGTELVQFLSSKLEQDMFLHIAQHARRSVNPPDDTWFAIAANKRGYKKHPHFQVGLFDDHVFVWFALIYELPNKKAIAEEMLNNKNELLSLPEEFMFSLDHTKKEASSIQELNEDHLVRFRDVKKAEFLIGKQFDSDEPIVRNGQSFITEVKKTYEKLLPFYTLAASAE